MTEKNQTIYAKLAKARSDFHQHDLKKSGHNKFAGYKYFELGDFVVPGLECMADNGLVPVVTFEPERAVMRIFEADGDGRIEIESPRAAANLKGCHPIQNLGAEETYQRRYLWMAALEIVEHDVVDAAEPAAPAEKINESQIADLEAKMQEVGADKANFMRWLHSSFGASELADLTAEQYPHIIAMLDKKAKQ